MDYGFLLVEAIESPASYKRGFNPCFSGIWFLTNPSLEVQLEAVKFQSLF